MKISYAITVCNEHKEIEKLLTFLFEHKRPEDQVVVQMDMDATKEVIDICERFEGKPMSEYSLIQFELNKNFAEYKNNLNKHCDGNWIFQIDADEIPNEYLIEALPFILEANDDTEAFWVPRVNTVAGITDEHITKWGWNVTCLPDALLSWQPSRMQPHLLRSSAHCFSARAWRLGEHCLRV